MQCSVLQRGASDGASAAILRPDNASKLSSAVAGLLAVRGVLTKGAAHRFWRSACDCCCCWVRSAQAAPRLAAALDSFFRLRRSRVGSSSTFSPLARASAAFHASPAALACES
jgi:hypothetical protein